MAYDEGLAERLLEQFEHREDLEVKKMFGGLCFMLSKHMCCGIVGDMLMARVGPTQYEQCLAKPYASEMDFTGKAMKGMIYVSPIGIESDKALSEWTTFCTNFVDTLPPK